MFDTKIKAITITLKKLFMPEVEEGMFFENPAKENEIIHKTKKKKKKMRRKHL